jgi:hypothetical protein
VARPKKQKVDYFPHYCDHGKTLFILETKWGNDGYAFFYKLCELLGRKEGHAYDCSSVDAWEYLMAKTHLDPVMAVSIIDKLADLNVIDPALWGAKIIWMQSFVDSITDVYNHRKVGKPLPPALRIAETPLNGISDLRNPQSIVKESIVKESIPSEFQPQKPSPVDNSENPPPLPDTDEPAGEPPAPDRKEALEKEPKKNPTPSRNTHGERWTKKQGQDLEELIKEIQTKIKPYPFQQVYQFTQTYYNRANPDAILKVLQSYRTKILKGEVILKPLEYLVAALMGSTKTGKAGENGKFEAAESERRNEEFKKQDPKGFESIGSILARASP